MRKQATAGDMIARMQAKAAQDEHMAIIKERYAPWQPGEWEELLAIANADRVEARKTFAFLAGKAQAWHVVRIPGRDCWTDECGQIIKGLA